MKLGLGSSSIVALAVVLLLLFAPANAAAQTTVEVVGDASLVRVDRNGVAVPKRPVGQEPEGLSSQDCVDDQRIRVPLRLTAFQPNAVLETWASLSGADCSPQVNRQGMTAICWKVTDGVPLQSTSTVDIRARRLLGGAVAIAGGNPSDELEACTKLDLTTLSVQFLYFGPGNLATPLARAAFDIRADTVGGAPPAERTIYPGDRRVELQWRAPAPLASTSAINVYCARLAPPAGDFTCGSPSLPAGTVLDRAAETSLRCGSVIGSNATRSVVGSTPDGRPLENRAIYGFALASVDAFGNVGPLSETLCEAPREGAELPSAKAEREQNDEASGCSAAPASPTSGGRAALALVFALALASALGSRRSRR